ncbi:keratin-associated protein 5-1, partial [Nilaparvata lugens]|uniref:keratin-associated protein 5-1 n=1 Tax=Nilaparvata lugens TaxID=108931 RepID=UPI00193E7F54
IDVLADSNDCPGSRTCRDYRCVDVCAGQCGVNAECYARNHIPVCTCPARYTGDPLVSCRQRDPEELCHPSPCGANTQCKVVNDRPVCTCLPGYFGSPLQGCRHECDSDADCGPSQACSNFKCTSPCASGACAPTANCEVRNHRAICSCPPGYFGDPFVSCSAECVVHEDCPYNKPMCSASRCVNPCAGQCGQNADCNVRDRTRAICSCPKDMTGDPFVYCRPFEKRQLPQYHINLCLPGYLGNALSGCQRGECQSDSECRSDQNCINYECKPVCVSQCGVDAICNARNHVAVCTCPPGYSGNALNRCYRDTSSSRSAYSRSRYYY